MNKNYIYLKNLKSFCGKRDARILAQSKASLFHRQIPNSSKGIAGFQCEIGLKTREKFAK